MWKHHNDIPLYNSYMLIKNKILKRKKKTAGPKDQKSYVLPHMQTLDQGQTQQGDLTLITR
jgi:hypothetical protein